MLVLACNKAVASTQCDAALLPAVLEGDSDAALGLLGGCLAGPASTSLHMRAALEMARISIQVGNYSDATRYLDLLRIMMQSGDR